MKFYPRGTIKMPVLRNGCRIGHIELWRWSRRQTVNAVTALRHDKVLKTRSGSLLQHCPLKSFLWSSLYTNLNTLHLMKVKIGRTVQIQALYFLYVLCVYFPTNRILRILPGMRDYSKFIQVAQVSACSLFWSKCFLYFERRNLYIS